MNADVVKEFVINCRDSCEVPFTVTRKPLPSLKNSVVLPKNTALVNNKATVRKSMAMHKASAVPARLARRANATKSKFQTPMASLEMMLTTKEFQKIEQLPKLPTSKSEKKLPMRLIANSQPAAPNINSSADSVINLPKCITVKPVNNWNEQAANLRKKVKEKLKEHVEHEVTSFTQATQTDDFESCGFVQLSNNATQHIKTFFLTCFDCDARYELSEWQQYILHFNKNAHKFEEKVQSTMRSPKISHKTVTKRILMPQLVNSTETSAVNSPLAVNDIISFPLEDDYSIDMDISPIFGEEFNGLADNYDDDRVSVSSWEHENSEPQNTTIIDFYKSDAAKSLRFLETLQDHPLLWHSRHYGPAIFDEEAEKFIKKFDPSMATIDFHISLKNARDLQRRFNALNTAKKAKKLEDEQQLQQYIDLINEVATLSESYAHTCDICSYYFLDKNDLFKHKFKKHKVGDISHICSCGLHFADSKGKEAHEATHNTKPNFTCEYCGLLFFSQRRVQNHILLNHPDAVPNPQPYQCTLCDEKFAKIYMLKWHKLKLHDPPRYKCNTCNKAYRKAFDFQRHIRSHLDQRDFICKECGKSFIAKHHLKSHLFKVHKASEHACLPCKTYFASYENLHEHMQKFHPNGTNLDRKRKQHAMHVKRYHERLKAGRPTGPVRKRVDNLKCKQCGIEFINVGELRQHKRDFEHYLGDCRYKCPHCESILSSNQTLVLHLRRVHKLQAKYSDVKYFEPYTGDSIERIDVTANDVDTCEEVKYAVNNLNFMVIDAKETLPKYVPATVASYEEVQFSLTEEEEQFDYLHEY